VTIEIPLNDTTLTHLKERAEKCGQTVDQYIEGLVWKDVERLAMIEAIEKAEVITDHPYNLSDIPEIED
jgi:hypothetical protein